MDRHLNTGAVTRDSRRKRAGVVHHDEVTRVEEPWQIDEPRVSDTVGRGDEHPHAVAGDAVRFWWFHG
ncbi:hypothetical protein GCM10029964_109230 [Kibdelosporangium lantanae]